MKIMLIALGVVFGGIIGFNLFKGFMIKRFFASYEAPPITISSVKAIRKNWSPRIAAVGNFVALNGVEVNSQAAGNVVKIHFESGQYVEKNQALIDIDDSVDQANLKFNQADMALKDLNYNRQASLLNRGATSSSTVDEAKANLQQAQANVEKIQAEITQKHITAPFSGKLGIRQVNLGQYISPGQTSIITLQSLDPLYIDFNLPEQSLNKLHIDQEVELSVDEFPDLLFAGKITAINSKVDSNTHNILVQATLPNCPADDLKNPEKSSLTTIKKQPDGNKKIVSCNTVINTQNHIDKFVFIPGMFASVSIEQPSVNNAIVLPATAISYSLYGNSVYVIEKDKDGKKDKDGQDILHANRIFVSTGEQEGNLIVINKGIKEGQTVVSSGEVKLQNGARVIINNSVSLNEVSNPDTLGQ